MVALTVEHGNRGICSVAALGSGRSKASERCGARKAVSRAAAWLAYSLHRAMTSVQTVWKRSSIRRRKSSRRYSWKGFSSLLRFFVDVRYSLRSIRRDLQVSSIHEPRLNLECVSRTALPEPKNRARFRPSEAGATLIIASLRCRRGRIAKRGFSPPVVLLQGSPR